MTSGPTVKIHQSEEKDFRVVQAEHGWKLRDVLLAAEASPYRGKFQTLNCQGLGICGTCKVLVLENKEWWERRSCQIQCFQDLEIKLI